MAIILSDQFERIVEILNKTVTYMGQTYREAIQSLVERTEGLYDDSGNLRDVASWNEKDPWNKLRTLFRQASTILRTLDDSLPDTRASFRCNGDYSK